MQNRADWTFIRGNDDIFTLVSRQQSIECNLHNNSVYAPNSPKRRQFLNSSLKIRRTDVIKLIYWKSLIVTS